MKIVKIGENVLINGDHTEAVKYLSNNSNNLFDLIIEDPDYKNIGKNFKNLHYDYLYKVLRKNCPLVQFTYNANGQRNCHEASSDVLVKLLKEKKFNYKSKVIWSKYFLQKLIPTKTSQNKTATPNDTDIIIIFLKSVKSLPKQLDLRKLCNTSSLLKILNNPKITVPTSSSIIHHAANQKTQFKPKKLGFDILNALSVEGNVILDTHMGSCNLGETAIQNNRIYYGIESHEALFNEAVEKLLKLTGLIPEIVNFNKV